MSDPANVVYVFRTDLYVKIWVKSEMDSNSGDSIVRISLSGNPLDCMLIDMTNPHELRLPRDTQFICRVDPDPGEFCAARYKILS